MIEIYGTVNCAFCDRSKMLCDMKGVEYVYKTLDVDYTREQLLDMVPVRPRGFPVVFLDGVFLGSYNELKAKLG